MARRIRRVVTLAVAVLLLVGMASIAEAGRAVERPLRTTYEAEWGVGTHQCDLGLVPIRIVGEGTGGLVGRFDAVALHCDNFSTGEITDGFLDITAANGDHLYATYEGSLIYHDDGTPGCSVNQHYFGGTGRFENAVGEADELSWITFLSETSGFVEGVVSGTITYDASDRSH